MYMLVNVLNYFCSAVLLCINLILDEPINLQFKFDLSKLFMCTCITQRQICTNILPSAKTGSVFKKEAGSCSAV